MNHERSLFPHTKIDWKIADLTQKATRAGGNIVMLIQLMKLHLSKAMFHDGNDDCTQVIVTASASYKKTILHLDALSMMALANVYLGREKMLGSIFENRGEC